MPECTSQTTSTTKTTTATIEPSTAGNEVVITTTGLNPASTLQDNKAYSTTSTPSADDNEPNVTSNTTAIQLMFEVDMSQPLIDRK